MPSFQTSSGNINLDNGDEEFLNARIVDISRAPITKCTTYWRVVRLSLTAKISSKQLLTLAIIGAHMMNPDFSNGTDVEKRSCFGGVGFGGV